MADGAVSDQTNTGSAASVVERKRAYRYEVIDHGGEGTKAIGDSPTILDWKYLGKEYTWTIYKLGQGVTGFITGKFMDKGYVEGDKYRSDKELADANA